MNKLSAVLGRESWFACATVLAFCFLGSVEAQALSKLIGQDYIETQGPACESGHDCIFHFNAVPAGMELLVTRVACSILVTNQDATLNVAELGYKSAASIVAPYSQLVPVIASTTATTRYFKINDTVSHPYSGTLRPSMRLASLFNFAFNGVSCTIAGTLKPLP